MPACPALSSGSDFLSTLLRHIDCQAQGIGASGYQVLADPGSPIALVLTALLTIFIALFGLRMAMGEPPSLRDSVAAVVKIGVVLAIATSWSAYRTVIYDVIIQGPGQVSAAIGSPAALPGSDGHLIGRLQAADIGISQLIDLGTGRGDLVSRPSADASAGAMSRHAPIGDDPAFGWARVLFLSSVVATMAIVKLTAGVLLALAPLFAGLLLFDLARGLFVGWLRALIFTVVASICVTIIFGVQLALLEPWLAQVIQLRQSKIITSDAPVELLILCLGFALAQAGALLVILRLAFTIDIPGRRPAVVAPPTISSSNAGALMPDHPRSHPDSSRAQAVAGALLAAQRREGVGRPQPSISSLAAASSGQAASTTSQADSFTIPLHGQTLRRTRPRKSIGAMLRDRRP